MVALAMLAYGPIQQPAGYHDFADKRPLAGIPNAADVLSNVGFAIVGAWGSWRLRGRRSPFRFMTIALVLTAIGSAYYHWLPNDTRLFWDRVPITLTAAGLLAGYYAATHGRERVIAVTTVLAIAGVASVMWWSMTRHTGIGDLRPYLLIQVAPLVLVPFWQWDARSPRHARLAFVFAALLFVAAKIAEVGDHAIFDATGVASGHTLKHLLATVASAILVADVTRRA